MGVNMLKGIKLSSIIFLVLLFGACVRGRVSPYPGFDYPSTNSKDVMIYYMPPPLEFEIIGEVETRGAPAASWSSVEYDMRINAAKIGGDAIVLISSREQYAGTYTTQGQANAFVYGNYVYYTYQPGSSVAMKRKHVVGLVIKWKKK